MRSPQIADVASGLLPAEVSGGVGEGREMPSDVLAALRGLPLRDRATVLRVLAAELFSSVSAPVVDWGSDDEMTRGGATVDDELAELQAERCALATMTMAVVEVSRSLEASARVLADQHARVVTRFDALDVDQLDRRLSTHVPPGAFACDDFAPLLGLTPGAAARWAETGGVLRSRYPRLLDRAGAGGARMRACEVVIGEFDHLDAADAARVEQMFLQTDMIHAGEAAIRTHLRGLLRRLDMSRPVDDADDAALIRLAFSPVAEQPALTELAVVMPADDAWQLDAAIEARARALVDEWVTLHGSPRGYPLARARVDALVDLALGHVRFAPEVRITVPVRVAPVPARMPWEKVLPAAPRHDGDKGAAGREHPVRQADQPWCCDARLGWTPAAGAPAKSLSAVATHVGSAPAGIFSASSGETAPAAPEGVVEGMPRSRGGKGEQPLAHSGIELGVPCSRGGRGSTRVADVDLPRIGQVSGDALLALGSTLGACVTVALAGADSGVTTWTAARTYRPKLSMRRHVEARDEHCRFPGCMRPAPMCDADHVVAHADGGSTSPANLQLLCRHHHRAKTFGGWAVAMTPDATCVWQSPTAQWFRTHPGDAAAHRISADEGMAIAAEAAQLTRPAA